MRQERQNRVGSNAESLAVPAKELAGMLGVSLRQIWRLNATGKLPRPVRLGGSVRWNRAEVMQWFNEAGCPDRQTWEARKGAEQC
ncbi:MAG: helix-turn-helix transcriptional regulator [Planctomycetota bacterium]|jgi:excisionase family DNA binding protein